MPTTLTNFTPRLYQETLAAEAAGQNTLVVLPTGLGKTAIALMLGIQRLNKYPNSRIIICAPTRPLVGQHRETFLKHSSLQDEEIEVLTGLISPQKRAEIFGRSRVIVTTPQGLENDILANRISLADVSLLVFDEAHRAVGDYSYVSIARRYMQDADHAHVLALTASPGADAAKITEVCNNLGIEHIERKDRRSPDVQPYIHKTDIRYIEVRLSAPYLKLQKILKECFSNKIKEMQECGYLKTHSSKDPRISKREVLQIQSMLQGELVNKNFSPEVLKGISLAAQMMKLMHAIELLESQGIPPLQRYLQDLFNKAQTTKTKATKILASDQHIRLAWHTIEQTDNKLHPKMQKLSQIVQTKIDSVPQAKIIVFNQYRDSIASIVEHLNTLEGVRAKPFVGQAKKRGMGLTQKEQIERIREFSEGGFNVAVMSSVGEEGLDIPEVDSVIFYEPIPSAIRSIQRRGRTGRHTAGQVIMLVAKGTRDEAYRWSAFHKEKRITGAISKAQDTITKSARDVSSNQSSLQQFEKKDYSIIVDSREHSKDIIHALHDMGVAVTMQRLEVADYLLSGSIGVEFKTPKDFVDSIIDGRILEQAKKMVDAFPTPLIVIQGDQDLYAQRNIHPHAVQGMLSTLALSFRIPVLFTRTPEETAHIFYTIIKREQKGSLNDYLPKSADPTSAKERQERIIAMLPGIGPVLARRILRHFGTVQKVLEASEEELTKIENVGAAKASMIREFLSSQYENS